MRLTFATVQFMMYQNRKKDKLGVQRRDQSEIMCNFLKIILPIPDSCNEFDPLYLIFLNLS